MKFGEKEFNTIIANRQKIKIISQFYNIDISSQVGFGICDFLKIYLCLNNINLKLI